MMKKSLVIFEKRPKVGGMQVQPLSGGRVAILEERENPLVIGAQQDEAGEVQVSRFALMEVMMVCMLSPDELAPLMDLDEKEWRAEVNRYSLGPAGDHVLEFGERLREEFAAIQGAMAQPKKKKTARKRARK